MPNELKQSGEKAIDSLKGQFHVARIRLTALYAVLLAVILMFSSVVLYSTLSNKLEWHIQEERGRRGIPPPEFRSAIPSQVRDDLGVSLVVVNGLLLFGSVVLSYWLAGMTLLPVQDAFERQRRFLSDASHELRTPLTILQTDLENELSVRGLKPGNKKQIASHLEEVERMGSLVKDLLLLSRLDAQIGMTSQTEEADLGKCATTATLRLYSYAQRLGIALSIEAVTSGTLMIKANPEHLVQALSNVIKNAIDYNKPGGDVKVMVAHTGHTVEVRIVDTGTGIPSDELKMLFERFYRVDKSRSRQIGGSGLGLSIAKSIVKAYDGTIAIASTEGAGTTVTLSWIV
jgi:signal transduction histidine kinase